MAPFVSSKLFTSLGKVGCAYITHIASGKVVWPALHCRHQLPPQDVIVATHLHGVSNLGPKKQPWFYGAWKLNSELVDLVTRCHTTHKHDYGGRVILIPTNFYKLTLKYRLLPTLFNRLMWIMFIILVQWSEEFKKKNILVHI